MNKIAIPPLKIQGIKSKLIPHIKKLAQYNYNLYIEPFMGSGVVGFNLAPKKAIFSDTNPHIINFYNSIKNGYIHRNEVTSFLKSEGEKLLKNGNEYYLVVRDRFNKYKEPLDFLFLNRSCFNGLIRFNLKGNFNVPYCKKDNRFSKSYITKIINQIDWVSKLIAKNDYIFKCCGFEESIIIAKNGDFIYCDPPYINRHADYFNKWTDDDETSLYNCLNNTESSFMLSNWHSNIYRKNAYMDKFWNKFNLNFVEHFYHLGAKENNRNAMKEVLIINYYKKIDDNFVEAEEKSLFGNNIMI